MTPAPVPLSGPARELSPAERRRHRQLITTRRRATGLLVAVTVAFVVSTVLVHRHPALAWVQATAVASMVGGLADWFAVTALFRRPLGLPIPHTAIVVERKDRFAETLGSFVQESFLTPEAVSARLQASDALDRVARWLADEDHAAELAGRAASALVSATDLLRDDDMQDVFDALVRGRIDRVAVAPVAGRAIEQLTKEGRHRPVLDAALGALSRYIAVNGPDLHRRLGSRSPWWLPGSVSTRMVGRLLDRSRTVLAEMAADRDHPIRVQLDAAIEKLGQQLQTDEWMRRRGEELKHEFLAQPTVRDLAATVWADVKTQVHEQAAAPGSELRTRLASAIARTGRRLQEEPALARSAERSVEALVRLVLTNFEDELVGLVTGTIARWDAADTSRRLELLLGPDLQYIRINGTVVGALAGLVLHAVAAGVQ